MRHLLGDHSDLPQLFVYVQVTRRDTTNNLYMCKLREGILQISLQPFQCRPAQCEVADMSSQLVHP